LYSLTNATVASKSSGVSPDMIDTISHVISS
jgi:hypothetical protein